jgi:hypothetical protein
MEDRAPAQLRVIHLVVHTLRAARCSAWLFGGWGLLAMKEQYPALRNGGPWRAKDKTDVDVLRVLASESGAEG